MQKKVEKKVFVSEIIAPEDVAINCLCSEENSCHWLSVG